MRKGIVEGCRDGVESSVALCTVLCSLFSSSRHHPEHEHFFNHSIENRAEWKTHVTLLCLLTSPPTPDIAIPHSSMFPALHASPSLPFPHPFLQTLLTLSLSCSLFLPHLFSLSLPPHPSLSPFLFFACQCNCVICFFPFTAPHPPSCSRQIETFCLLQGMLFLPY